MKPIPPVPTEFMTLSEAAREIGLSPNAVSTRIRAGQLPGQKFGNIYRIPVAQWTAYKQGTWQPRTTTAPIEMVKRRSA